MIGRYPPDDGGVLSDHISHSQLTTWLACGKKWQLHYEVGVPEVPAWWNVGGTTVHSVSELVCDTLESEGPSELFFDSLVSSYQAEFDKQVDELEDKSGFGRSLWRLPYRGGTEDWWRTEGPVMVERWYQWRTEGEAKDWKIAEFQVLDIEGEPQPTRGVELELLCDFTTDAPPVKMFIDRVFQRPDGSLVVVDLKTGSREIKTDRQLGVYRAGLLADIGVNAPVGGFWSGRKGELQYPGLYDLARYTPDLIGHWCSQFWRGVQANIFVANPGDACGLCSYQRHCVAAGGDQTWGYDPDVSVYQTA